MHLHFERNTNTKCDCTILSLSWMGKVPDDIPEVSANNLNSLANYLFFFSKIDFICGQEYSIHE